MSRIGKLPVVIPAKVSVEILPGNVVKVKGPLGELSQKVDPDIAITVEDNEIKFTRPTDQPRHRSMHGLYRALVHNMVVGVMMLAPEIKAEVPDVKKGENPVLILKSADKQLLGQVAAKVRSMRKPEPYKGKGIKFVGEQLRRKAGKTASAK